MGQFVQRAAIIGAGQIGSAMVRAIIEAGILEPGQIVASGPHRERLAPLAAETGVGITISNSDAVQAADVVVLAVKPQVAATVLAELRGQISRDATVLSIIAGMATCDIEAGLGNSAHVVRAMPNLPCVIGAGAIGMSLGSHAVPRDETRVRSMLVSLGEVTIVGEELMDAVTGLSGSGPGYVFLIIEALADAGVRAGLTREAARRLSAQTVFGAAKMVLETGRHPAELKEMVTSPGGTTITGLHLLEQRGLRGTLIDAVMAASERAGELGRSAAEQSGRVTPRNGERGEAVS